MVQFADGGEGVGIVFTKPSDPENHCEAGFSISTRVGGEIKGWCVVERGEKQKQK